MLVHLWSVRYSSNHLLDIVLEFAGLGHVIFLPHLGFSKLKIMSLLGDFSCLSPVRCSRLIDSWVQVCFDCASY